MDVEVLARRTRQSWSRIAADAALLERLVGDGHVRGEAGHAAGDRPGVQVVDVDHAGHAGRGGRGRRRGRARRGDLEQHRRPSPAAAAASAAGSSPRSPARRSGRPAAKPVRPDHDAGRDREHRAEQVGEHLGRGAAQVEASRSSDRFRIASETALATRPTSAKTDQRPGVDRRRVDQPGDAGVRQVAADPQQHQRVDQRGEDLGPVPAERRARAGRPARRRTTPRARARRAPRRWPCGRRRRAAPASRSPRHRPARRPAPLPVMASTSRSRARSSARPAACPCPCPCPMGYQGSIGWPPRDSRLFFLKKKDLPVAVFLHQVEGVLELLKLRRRRKFDLLVFTLTVALSPSISSSPMSYVDVETSIAE